MHSALKKYWIAFAVSLLSFGILSWLEQKQDSDRQYQLRLAGTHAQQVIIDKELEYIRLLKGPFSDTSNLQRNWSGLLELARENHFSVNIFKNDTLQLWTDHQLNLNPILSSVNDGTSYLQLSNGHYVVFKQRNGSYISIFAFLVKSEYAFRNQYIENSFSPDLSFIKEGFILSKPVTGFTDIKSLSGKYLFSLQAYSYSEETPLWLMLGFILSALLSIIFIHLLGRIYFRQNLLLSSIIFFGLFSYIRWINVFYHSPVFLYKLKLFDPVIYASSTWFPSLGDLLIDSAIVLWYFILLETRSKQDTVQLKHKKAGLPRLIFLCALCFIAAHVVISSIRSITLDSQISFDINNFFSINFFTYVGLVVSIIQLLIVYFVCRNFARVAKAGKQSDKRPPLVFIACAVAYVCYAALESDNGTFLPLTVLLLSSTFVLFKILSVKLNRFQQYFIVILIISVCSALCIDHWLDIKEKENRKLFAVKLISQNDITTDYYLRSVEKKMLNDDFLVDYYQNPLIIKPVFEKRIRQLYFTGYLSKYEVNVYDYDSAGFHFRQRNPYTFAQINNIYRENTIETINPHFRYISSTSLARGYLAKFEIRKNRRLIGYLFISLLPKLIQDENRFDELLIEGYRQRRKDQNYAYAVYKNKNLIFQSGDYPYRITNTWGETNNEFRFFEENNYDHLLYTDLQPMTIAVSKAAPPFPQVIGLFSFIFTFCTVTLIVVLFVYVGVNAQFLRKYIIFNNPVLKKLQFVFNRLLMIDKPEILYIRTRIQTSIIFILFITLIFSGYFTISFITKKYNNRQNERLMKKLRNVVLTIENEKIKDLSWTSKGEVDAFINQIADFYDTDITLFDKSGKLVASSISKIYDEGIIANTMDPNAYYHLSLLKSSQFMQQEYIASLRFEAAYAPVFRNKTEVMGYLQLPYFSQQADLLAEISSIVVGFINLYVVLFIIIGVIAYLVSRNISYPLTLIEQKLSNTVLGGRNEPIVWQREDEIGELVKKYNAMILALEHSARKLAEREREGAWREIARQIAHEIKNPLTPMKLSIQHLQRAYKNKDSNLEDKIDRTARLLIQQIDTLSELATEFSSFAKMPAPYYEKLDVCAELQQIVDLYSVNSDAVISFSCGVHTELYFDRSYLSRSVGNLVKNAIQAIPEDKEGRISITAEEDNENIIISVKDNGSGISPDQAENIFKPYFSTKVSGMGLGLPIVKNMIENARGSIRFTSEPGQGTTFVLRLPKQQS